MLMTILNKNADFEEVKDIEERLPQTPSTRGGLKKRKCRKVLEN